jgi:hypothetical protein
MLGQIWGGVGEYGSVVGEFGGGCVTDGDGTLSQQIFNITVAEIESVVGPDCKADDIRQDSVTFICIHWPILSISAT